MLLQRSDATFLNILRSYLPCRHLSITMLRSFVSSLFCMPRPLPPPSPPPPHHQSTHDLNAFVVQPCIILCTRSHIIFSKPLLTPAIAPRASFPTLAPHSPSNLVRRRHQELRRRRRRGGRTGL